MSKRRRVEEAASGPQLTTTTKPLSAIAAARLRAQAKAKSIITPEVISEPVPESAILLPQSPTPEPLVSESEEEPLIVRHNVKLCNWRNESQNILSDTETELTVKLAKHTTIALIGCFRFKVVRGAVNINGANIGPLSRNGKKDQVYTSYAPATHPISKIRGLDDSNHVQFISCDEPRPFASTSPLFADIWNARIGSGTSRSFSVITESDADPLARSLSAEKSPEDWLRAVEDCAIDPSVVVTVGPSSTGKSIFARRLLNRYLTGQGKAARPLPAVCYLDLDPEKPEYTPHGQISLIVVRSLNLGPSFTHLITPSSPLDTEANSMVRSHCMPTSLMNHRDHYRACAEDLFLAYRVLQSHDPSLPLVINISGSLYSLDFDLLLDLLARFKPHHTIHMSDIGAIDNEQATKLHSLHTVVSQYRGSAHEITAQAPSSLALRTDTDLRAMYMQTYFHLTKSNRTDLGTMACTSNPISKLVPWEFCFEGTKARTQDFVGFAVYSEPVEPTSLVQSLNGSIVQIVESTSSAIPTPYASLPRTSKYRVPYFVKSDRTGMVEPLDPKTSKFICTAMVRGFDPENKLVQVLVPKSHENLLHGLLPERTVFVGGCCEQPEWAYLEDADAASMGSGPNCTPWLEEETRVDDMGYLNTVRRVRKFQT